MLKYFINYSLCVVLFFASRQAVCAQEAAANLVKKDSIVADSIARDTVAFPRKYGLRLGVDIAGIAYGIYNKNFRQTMLTGDYRITKNLFAAGEGGYMYKKNIEDLYTYQTEGFFAKMGINYNVYNNWLEMDNEIYFGFRYALSLFNQTLKNYTIFQRGIVVNGDKTRYFPQKKVATDRKYVNLDAHWMEISLGVKTEIFSNFYVTLEATFKNLFSSKEPPGFKNLYIPGFYTVYEGGTGFALSYILSYRIPIYKK